MKPSAAGKGSDPRPVKISKYVENFDNIRWTAKNKQPSRVVKGKQVYVYSN